MKRRWWIKYLVLFVIILISGGISIIIGAEGVFFLLILYVLPPVGFLALISFVYEIFHSELFRKINMKLWWIKYAILIIPAISIYLAGWFEMPLDNRSFLFSRTIWFGKMIAPWKVYIGMPLIILALMFIGFDTFQYFKLKKRSWSEKGKVPRYYPPSFYLIEFYMCRRYL